MVNAEVVNRNEMDIDELLRQVEPRDLTKFGLIPQSLLARISELWYP